MKPPGGLGRWTLALLVQLIASVLFLGSMFLVEYGAAGHDLDEPIIWMSAGLICCGFLAVVIVLAVSKHADTSFFSIAFALNGLGIAEIHRIDIEYGHSGWVAAGERQIVWAAVALLIVMSITVAVPDHRRLQRLQYVAMLATAVLLTLPLVPGLGRDVGGARVWIKVGSGSFQPAELARVTAALFFAAYLSRTRDSLALVGRKFGGVLIPRGREAGPLVLVWCAAMLILVFQRDLGTALLFFGMFLVLIYVSTGQVAWVGLSLVLFAGGAALVASRLAYVRARFEQWLHPFDDAVYYRDTQSSEQLVRGLFSFARGGLTGTGLGRGSPGSTPLAQSDYIVASLGEELGLAGVMAILVLFLLLIARGMRLAFFMRDDFGRLLAVALSSGFALQVFVVVGGITRILPVTGLTTPFLAAGGSSIVANWISIGLLLRLSNASLRGAEISSYVSSRSLENP